MSVWAGVTCGNVPALLPPPWSDVPPIPLGPHDLQSDAEGRQYVVLSTKSPTLIKFLTDGRGRGNRAPTGRNYVRAYLRTYV